VDETRPKRSLVWSPKRLPGRARRERIAGCDSQGRWSDRHNPYIVSELSRGLPRWKRAVTAPKHSIPVVQNCDGG